ncbi:MAG: hypothetical protein HC889_16450 [Synechococcaceae cyanobacterium SM1_2_3]|nr:hypothetical protein [Synechococcaceae cyanobacterium SM1_2_3]
MRYAPCVERIDIRKAMEKSLEKQLNSGWRTLWRLIRSRFGESAADLSAPVLERIAQSPILEDLFENVLDCPDESAWLARLHTVVEKTGGLGVSI